MKKILCLAAGLLALNVTTGIGQTKLPLGHVSFSTGAEAPALTKFNLDFPGGTPKQLVAAIEKAMGKQLNVIIAMDEKSAKAMMPPIKVTDMDVARLFESLKKQKFERNNEQIYGEGFYTRDEPPKDNSLWTFSVYEKQPALTLFSLDFPGGTPAQLVAAIKKATGKPLNAIIPTESADTDLPPIKMNDVDVQRLFSALEIASAKQMKLIVATYGGGNESYSTYS